jgi:CHAT domain-containing protein
MKARTWPRTASSNGSNQSPPRQVVGVAVAAGVAFSMAWVPPWAQPSEPTPPPQISTTSATRPHAFRDGFVFVKHSGDEVTTVADLYRIARPDELVGVWVGPRATEGRLKARASPPRVLHLATHGFYRPPAEAADLPMLLAGVTLAGANQALQDKTEDGILYAIEAQDLNLEGTELVVLSACETAQGQIDYGEGVYGLVRALRTAGAQNVLVTLRRVDDLAARDFMERFYRHWLGQDRSDPAAALRATQLDYVTHYPDHDWSAFVLIGSL